MKIWMIMPGFPPRTGGAATYSHLLTNYIKKNLPGSEVVVFTEYIGGAFINFEEKLFVFRILPNESMLDRFIFGKIWTGVCLLIDQFIVAAIMLAASISSAHPIVHIHNTYARGAMPFLAKLMRCPTVCDIRDMFFSSRNCWGYTKFIVCTMAMEERVSASVPRDSIVYIPVPIDIELIMERSHAVDDIYSGERPYILYAGWVAERKGINELIEAYRHLLEKHMDSPDLLLAGRIMIGSSSQITKETPKIKFLGDLPSKNVPALIKNSTLVILPSPEEAIGRIILEAISLGIPVLCPPGVKEYETYCPHCVLPTISAQVIADYLAAPSITYAASDYPIYNHDLNTCLRRTIEVYIELTKLIT